MSSYEESSKHVVRNVLFPFYENIPEACWVAEFHKGDNRKESKWVIRATNYAQKEFSFRIASLGDVLNDTFWAAFTSIDFAVNLISNFKKGHAVLEKWLDDTILIHFPKPTTKTKKSKAIKKYAKTVIKKSAPKKTKKVSKVKIKKVLIKKIATKKKKKKVKKKIK